jgi:hypothetical protein
MNHGEGDFGECEDFEWANGRGKKHLKDVGVGGRIKFKLNLEEKGRDCVDWFGLAQNWEKWWAALWNWVLAAKCGEFRVQMRNH